MIERQFVSQKKKEFGIQEYVTTFLGKGSGYSHTEIKRTPLGEKVIIYTSRPGLVVGKKGDNIKRLTITLKKKFNMDNPQIEIGEITDPYLDVYFITDKIVSTFERYGSKRFKAVGYKLLQDVMDAGALGVEIVISGKVPSQRARSWRFKTGYLKKSGDIAESFVKKFVSNVSLKSGIIGVKVKIMTPNVVLPDKVTFKTLEKEEQKVEEKKEDKKEEKKERKKRVKENKKKEEVQNDRQDEIVKPKEEKQDGNNKEE